MYTSSAFEEDLTNSSSPTQSITTNNHSPRPGEPKIAEENQNKFKVPSKIFTSPTPKGGLKLNKLSSSSSSFSFVEKMNQSQSPSPTLSSTTTKIKREWPPRLYLAIDCGGTKAAAAICNEQGELIGRGQGGPANYTDIGLRKFLASVENAVKTALKGAKTFYNGDGEDNVGGGIGKEIEWQINPSTLNRTLPQQQSIPSPQPQSESQFSQQQQDGSDFESDGIHSSRPSTSGRMHGESGDEDDDERKSSFSSFSIQDALASIKPFSIPSNSPIPQFEAAWLGIAGVDSPADVTTLSPHLGKLLSIPYPGNRLIVANDTSLLASPIADSLRPEIKSGVVAIAGTGSIVMSFRRKRNGMLRVLGRVGGFGWLIGDEGSGYSVGRTAVRKVLDLTDRERLDMETACMMKETKLEEEEDSDSDIDDIEEDVNGGDNRIGKHSSTSGEGEDVMDDTMATFEMDGARRMTSKDEMKSFSDPISKNQSPTTTNTTVMRSAYGHLLRDRILQHWGLISTDELLRAVYFDEAHGGQPNGRGVPAAVKASAGNNNNRGSSSASSETNCIVSITDHGSSEDVCGNNTLSRSDTKTIRGPIGGEGISSQTLRNKLMKRFEIPRNFSDNETNSVNSSSTNGAGGENRLSISPTRTSRTSLSSVMDEPSASLLPPSAHTLDNETRLRGVSPIPSLSSSPGSRYSTTFSDVFPSPREALFNSNSSSSTSATNELNRININHDDPMRSADSYSSNQSALATELTSASSSLSMTMSTNGGGNLHRHSVDSVGGMMKDRNSIEKVEQDFEMIKNGEEEENKRKSGEIKLRSTLERKHRLASLAPLVFHLAFTHNDECSLEILRSQAYFMALQIAEICKVENLKARAFLNVEKSTLCLGGSLVGVEKYRTLLLEELKKLGIQFARVEFVGDPAKRGALALSHVMERSRQQQQ